MHFGVRLSLGAGILFLIHCGADSSTSDSSDSEIDVAPPPSAAELASCPDATIGKNAKKDTLVQCKKFYGAAPYIRPPADTSDGRSITLYAGVTTAVGYQDPTLFWNRKGERFV